MCDNTIFYIFVGWLVGWLAFLLIHVPHINLKKIHVCMSIEANIQNDEYKRLGSSFESHY